VHSLLTDIVQYVCYVETIYYMIVMLLWCGTGLCDFETTWHAW